MKTNHGELSQQIRLLWKKEKGFRLKQEVILKAVCSLKIFSQSDSELENHIRIFSIKLEVCVCSFMSDSATPWTVAVLPPQQRPPPTPTSGSSVYEISQARILEWVAISSSRDLPDPGIELTSPASPALAGGFFTTAPSKLRPLWEILKKKTHWATRAICYSRQSNLEIFFPP